MITKRNKQIST